MFLTIIDCAKETIKTDWKDIVIKYLTNQPTNKLDKILEEDNYLPAYNQIFRCFNYFNIKKTRVVILGQDPYPTIFDDKAPNANGLAFSTGNGNIPASLKNIFKELHSEYIPIYEQLYKRGKIKDKIPKLRTNPDLSDWAKQGVLLINTVLTTTKGEKLGHQYLGWERFVGKIISYISLRSECVCFIIWGGKAAKYIKYINDLETVSVISSSHPSPLSFKKTNNPFITSKCFFRCNKFLIKNKQCGIVWF